MLKRRVGCGKQLEDLPSAELQSRFIRLQSRTCLWADHSDDDDDDIQYNLLKLVKSKLKKAS